MEPPLFGNRSKNPATWMWLCVAILPFMGSGCAFDTVPEAQESLPLETPAALNGAQLLFHRPDGLYLMTLGQDQARNMHPQGRYGRWAPDGHSFAFLAEHQVVWHDLKTETSRPLAQADNARAISFHPDGHQIFFTDGDTVRAVEILTGEVRNVLTGPEFLELDIASDGRFMAATVRRRGYRVLRFELPSGKGTDFGRGCSAGVSADDRWIMVNSGDHLELVLHDSDNGEALPPLHAPAGYSIDNQKWANHNHWIAGIVEQPAQDITVQFVPDGRVWRVTDVGDADRPDLFIPPPHDS